MGCAHFAHAGPIKGRRVVTYTERMYMWKVEKEKRRHASG